MLLASNLSAQVIIKEKVEINPQTINPEYQISALDPCPGISRPQYYQSVYSCSGFPIEPYQQLYPFQSGTALILNQTDIYEVEVIAGSDYAYFERVEHTDSAGNFYPYETFGTLLSGLTGAELSGTGNFIGYEGAGTFDRENSTVYRVRFDNYSLPEVSVTIRIKNLNNNTFTDWHTLIVNPELQFTDQQNADTLLHYYSTDVTPVLRNVNFPCPHPGYGGCPPEDVTFNIEITEGQQYGSIKKELTGEVSTSFTGIPYNELSQFTYYANGVQPDSIATVRILHSSSDAELIPIEYEFTVKRNTVPPPSEGGSIYVKMDKRVVIPGDTINVQLRWIDEVGDTIDFLPMQRFRVDLAEGSEYGTILDILTADTSDTFTEITNEFKVITAAQIEPQQAKIILVAEADLMIFTRPVRINNGTKTAKQIQESKVDKNDEQGGNNTDFIIIGNHLVGVGEITITKTPFVVEIIPPIVSAGDTAQIIPMKLNPDGTTAPFDSLQTFELGMLDGCLLGKLSNAGIDTNYFYGVTQPFYFIADTSADSGSVNIRVGVIDMNQQNRSLTSNNQLQPDNPVTYCFLNTYQTKLFLDESVVVGNECNDYPCDQGFVYASPRIVSKLEDIIWSNSFTNEHGTKVFSGLKGGETFILFDDKIYVNGYPIKDELVQNFQIEPCFKDNNWQFLITTAGDNNEIKLKVYVALYDWGYPNDIDNINELNIIPENENCLALKDFEKHRPYRFNENYPGFEPPPSIDKYFIKDATINHEKVHVKFFQLDIKDALKIKTKHYGALKTFKEHLKFTPECTSIFNNKDNARFQATKYYNLLLKEFVKKLQIVNRSRFPDSRTEENKTQWNDDVQSTIDYYQRELRTYWKNQGKPIRNCDFKEFDWSEYTQYKNKI